jgi:ketosteroid isomerase-like protein
MDEWGRFMDEQRAALDAFVRGDPRPLQQIWSQTDEVSLLGAFGGRALGWEAVRARLEAAAAAYRSGAYERLEILVEQVLGDAAYTVHEERIGFLSAAGDALTRERRVTQIYRREPVAWRILHHHSDPLVSSEIPA